MSELDKILGTDPVLRAQIEDLWYDFVRMVFDINDRPTAEIMRDLVMQQREDILPPGYYFDPVALSRGKPVLIGGDDVLGTRLLHGNTNPMNRLQVEQYNAGRLVCPVGLEDGQHETVEEYEARTKRTVSRLPFGERTIVHHIWMDDIEPATRFIRDVTQMGDQLHVTAGGLSEHHDPVGVSVFECSCDLSWFEPQEMTFDFI